MKTKSITSAQLAELQNCLQRINDILGLSITISDVHTTHRSSTCSRKRTTPRVTNATFTYRWLAIASHRITTLYQYLLRAQWIAADTNPDDFLAIFSGQPSTTRVKWIEKQSYLYYFIRRAVDKELIYIPNKRKIWQVTESHFIDGYNRPFYEIRKQKVPKTAIPTIEKMLEILLPST